MIEQDVILYLNAILMLWIYGLLEKIFFEIITRFSISLMKMYRNIQKIFKKARKLLQKIITSILFSLLYLTHLIVKLVMPRDLRFSKKEKNTFHYDNKRRKNLQINSPLITLVSVLSPLWAIQILFENIMVILGSFSFLSNSAIIKTLFYLLILPIGQFDKEELEEFWEQIVKNIFSALRDGAIFICAYGLVKFVALDEKMWMILNLWSSFEAENMIIIKNFVYFIAFSLLNSLIILGDATYKKSRLRRSKKIETHFLPTQEIYTIKTISTILNPNKVMTNEDNTNKKRTEINNEIKQEMHKNGKEKEYQESIKRDESEIYDDEEYLDLEEELIHAFQ